MQELAVVGQICEFCKCHDRRKKIYSLDVDDDDDD